VLYPVAGQDSRLSNSRIEASLNREDPPIFVAERPFAQKIKVGFPKEDSIGFLPDTGAAIIVLSVEIQNLSQTLMELDLAKFTVTDATSRKYSRLSAAEAFDRIMAETPLHRNILTRTIRGASLGRLSSKEDVDQAKRKTVLLALESGQVPAHGFKEGLIFFEAPTQKNFTVSVTVGDLWPRPFTFTSIQPKQ